MIHTGLEMSSCPDACTIHTAQLWLPSVLIR